MQTIPNASASTVVTVSPLGFTLTDYRIVVAVGASAIAYTFESPDTNITWTSLSPAVARIINTYIVPFSPDYYPALKYPFQSAVSFAGVQIGTTQLSATNTAGQSERLDVIVISSIPEMLQGAWTLAGGSSCPPGTTGTLNISGNAYQWTITFPLTNGYNGSTHSGGGTIRRLTDEMAPSRRVTPVYPVYVQQENNDPVAGRVLQFYDSLPSYSDPSPPVLSYKYIPGWIMGIGYCFWKK